MGLWAWGINHKTASVRLREKLALPAESRADVLREAQHRTGLQELVILSTCNRTEIYGQGEVDEAALLHWLADSRQLSLHELSHAAYQWTDAAAVRHMMRVAAGLDSMVLGEPQILGQMKVAYQEAHTAGTLGHYLDQVFQQVFACAKQVRSETAIGINPVSVGFAAVTLARQIFSRLESCTALLVGAGETIELVGRHLQEQGVRQLIIANRTLHKAKTLASQLNGRAVALEDIPMALGESDIVFSSTASTLPLIGKGMVERALQVRRYRPMLMVDMAVPRDIEAEVADLDDVFLYTVDDLEHVIADNRKARAEAAEAAEVIIEARTVDFLRQVRSLDAVNTIRHWRAQVEDWRLQEMERAQQLLTQGTVPAEVLDRMSRALMNKILHHPTVALRQWAAAGKTEALELGAEMLGIDTSIRSNQRD